MGDPVILEATLKRFGLEVSPGMRPLRLAVPGVGRVLAYVAPGYERRSLPYLFHLALLPEIRLRLGVPLEAWEVEPEGKGTLRPDALWEHQGKRIAVEVDYRYDLEKVRRKVRHYRKAYGGQVWGVTSPRKEQVLRALLWPDGGHILRLSLREILSL